jgi:hypothetical protein
MTLRIGSIALTKDRRQPFEAISHRITRLSADILLVSGFRTGMRGMQLRATLDQLGLIYQTPCDTEPHEDALILGSRCPFVQIDLPVELQAHRRDCLHLGIADFRLIACGPESTAPDHLWPYLRSQAEQLRRDKAILFSCSQVAQQAQNPSGAAASDEALASALTGFGYLDAYQLHSQPERDTPQWERPPFSAFVTPALAPQLNRCFQSDPSVDKDSRDPHAAILNMG